MSKDENVPDLDKNISQDDVERVAQKTARGGLMIGG